MKWIFFLILGFPIGIAAQSKVSIKVLQENNQLPLAGIQVKISPVQGRYFTDSSGQVYLPSLPPGKYRLELSGAGFKEKEWQGLLPQEQTVIIYIEPETRELEEVTVISTRSNRAISNTPSRVEVIAGEEIHEEATMRPGDIRMLLAESTGIQTQQTSATSANAGIRIQGLDGRYTLILKDGFPVYAGAAAGLGLLQTPPLDLRQVEIIKGSSSTLYGGGAIAGMVNLLTKIPRETREWNSMVNLTSAGGVDLSSFYGKRNQKTGVTVYAARNSNKAYDPAGNGFSAIPAFTRYTLNPKLFLFINAKSQLQVGINSTWESRLGGDMALLSHGADSLHRYFEDNHTRRVASQLSYDRVINSSAHLQLKNSVSYFNRAITSEGYAFDGSQLSTFSEAVYTHHREAADWVAGLNLVTDRFTEKPFSGAARNYRQLTAGVFLQNTWNVTQRFTLESGIRLDGVEGYGAALLPRLSALFNIAPGITSRLGGGLGYKAPTIFTEETEKVLYRNILPVDGTNRLEKSYGFNGDFTIRKKWEGFSFSWNQFFFYTRVQHPLLPGPGGRKLVNIPGYTDTRGTESNVRLGLDELALYLGYTFTDARLHNNGTSRQTLSPRHRFNAALTYEIEGKWRFGSELYYFSPQLRTGDSKTPGYWLTGLVAERTWKQVSLFLNFENFGDVRQTRFEAIYTGPVSAPVFRDLYAPLEGFVVNGGLRVAL